MILSTLSFAAHILVSSFRILEPVGVVLEYVLPQYRSMATKAVKAKVNFNTKHLKKGDPLPPHNGKIRVYNMRYCPFAQRTVLALIAKKLDFEVVNINLRDKPEWFTSKSAFAEVPSLEVNENVCIYESLVTVEYLDEVFPERRLLPKDPLAKASDKILIEATNPIHAFFYKTLRNPDTITDEDIKAYNKGLDFVQTQLVSRGTKFLDGSEPGFADYMIWPWFERILAFTEAENLLKIDPEQFKVLLEYLSRMVDDPAVREYLIPKEVLLKYFDTNRKGGIPEYDLLLENY